MKCSGLVRMQNAFVTLRVNSLHYLPVLWISVVITNVNTSSEIMMQVHITDFWNVTPCSLVEIRRFLYEPTAFVFHPKDKGSKFLQNAGKIYQTTRGHNLGGGGGGYICWKWKVRHADALRAEVKLTDLTATPQLLHLRAQVKLTDLTATPQLLQLATCLSALHCHCHLSQQTFQVPLIYRFIFRRVRETVAPIIGFVMCVRVSVCPHGTIRLQMDKFAWNLYRDFYFFVEDQARSSENLKILCRTSENTKGNDGDNLSVLYEATQKTRV